MAANENVSSISISFSPDTNKKEESAMSPEASLEEGHVPPPSPNKISNSLKQRALSAVSKKYDIDGDGKLDEAEQAMRNLDTEGRGYLTNDKVLTVFQHELKMQKQLLLAKRLVIFFALLLVILAVANIGVAFAAARLSKDTTTQNNVLVVKDSGQVVATNNHADVYEVETELVSERRTLVTGEGVTSSSTLTSVSLAHAQDMYQECSQEGVSVKLRRTWTGYNLEEVIELCPGMSYSHDANANTYTYVLQVLMYGGAGLIAANKIIQMDCHADPCAVTANGLYQTVNEPCVYDSDCESSNCVIPSDVQTGVCKMPLGAACGSHGDCEFNYCQASQAFGSPGSCTCNPSSDATTSGCTVGETCYSANEQLLATNIVDVGPRCLLPVGAACTDSFECLTNACLSMDGSGTNKTCVCSSINYPCADGEACVNGTCQVSTGSQTTCPQVPVDNFCFEVMEPLKCGKCCYSNSCRAAAAAATDSTFDTSTCATPADGDCPEGSFI